MWILRFHLLQTKDYNKINRICKKYGFVTKHHSAVVYAKAVVKHSVQHTSWRALGREFWVDHNSLYKFYDLAKNTGLLREIFHTFLCAKVSLYIGDMRTIDTHSLDNSEEIFRLTQKAFENMLEWL